VLRARCLSYGQEISLWLIADLLRSLLGITEGDRGEEIHIKLAAAVSALLVHCAGETEREATDVLGEVVGLPPGDSPVAQAGPQIRRQALLRSLKLLLSALSERAPTVIVLEDVHWIDAARSEIINEVLSDLPGLRLLALVAQRPGWNAPWSEWGWTERLTLRPLREGGPDAWPERCWAAYPSHPNWKLTWLREQAAILSSWKSCCGHWRRVGVWCSGMA